MVDPTLTHGPRALKDHQFQSFSLAKRNNNRENNQRGESVIPHKVDDEVTPGEE